jgi:hypothetical protein
LSLPYSGTRAKQTLRGCYSYLGRCSAQMSHDSAALSPVCRNWTLARRLVRLHLIGDRLAPLTSDRSWSPKR